MPQSTGMPLNRLAGLAALLFGLSVGLGACGFADQALVPTLTGEPPAKPAPVAPAPLTPAQQAEDMIARLGGLQTDTKAHYDGYDARRAAIESDAGAYDSLVGEIMGGLDGGAQASTLDPKWASARGKLQDMSVSVAVLNSLLDKVSTTSTKAAALAIRAQQAQADPAFGPDIQGQLLFVQDEAERVAASNSQLLEALRGDIEQTQGYYSRERLNLADLKLAIQKS